MAKKRPSADDPFPDPSTADRHGVVCAGAAPYPELLRIAYGKGIFPWPHDGTPLLWFSPDPRYLVEPGRVHLHRSLRKALRKTQLRVTADTAFEKVMEGCASVKRQGQGSTWITDEMIEGYTALHKGGLAHSVEAWDGDTLVGGLYGVSIGAQFCGESMFARVDDASKIGFATLAAQLHAWGFHFIDCQTYTEHTSRFGTIPTPRATYLERLGHATRAAGRPGPWVLDRTPADAVALLRAPLPEEHARGTHDVDGDDEDA
jgi:leucyl/phenylalanyl-tRNA--protein transferase